MWGNGTNALAHNDRGWVTFPPVRPPAISVLPVLELSGTKSLTCLRRRGGPDWDSFLFVFGTPKIAELMR